MSSALLPALVAGGCANNSGNTSVACTALAPRPPTSRRRVVRHGVHHRDGEPQPRRDPRQHGRAVHQPARERRTRSPPATTTRTCTRASRTTSGWSSGENFGDPRRQRSGVAPPDVDLAHRRPDRARGPDLEVLPGGHGRAVRPDLARPLRREARPVRLLRRRQRLGRHARSSRRRAATSTSSTTRSSTPTSRRNAMPRLRVHHAEPRRRHARRLDRAGRRSGCAREVPEAPRRPTRSRTAA